MWQTFLFRAWHSSNQTPRPLRSFGALQTRLQTRTVGMVRALYLLEYQSGCLRSVSALISHDWGRFPVSKRPESIVPIFSQEQGVQSIYEFAPACGGSLVAQNKSLQQLTIFPISLVETFTRIECLACGLPPKN